jgi:Spy/CpxP family protein refolding chaperone
MKTLRFPVLVLSMSLAFGLTACSGSVDTLAASNLGNEQLQASSSVFTLNGTTAPDALAEGGRGGRGGPGKGHMGKGGPGGAGGPVLMGLFHSAHLNLTEAQQTALQTLQSEFQSAQPKPEAPDEATRTAQQEAFKQAFLNATLTVDVLKALQPTRSEPDTAALAAHWVAVSKVFTAEQKATLAAEVAEREANRPAAADRPERPASDAARPDPLVDALGLSEAQATQLAALRAANRPTAPSDADLTAKQAQHQALVAELLKDSPNVATVQSLLASARPAEAKADGRLTELVQIHDLLTAEQRQKFVDLQAQGPLAGKGHPGGGGMGRPPHDLGNFGGAPAPRDMETAIL